MQELDRDVVNHIINNTKKFYKGCFVAGTLVRIKSETGSWQDEYKNIEDIKVGDWVLSKPEDGSGEPAYKQVVNTFVYEDKEVWLVETTPLVNWVDGEGGLDIEDSGAPGRFAVTPNHPFRVCGYTSYYRSIQDYAAYAQPRWMRVDQLTDNDVVMDDKGGLYAVVVSRPLSKMKNSDLAWLRGGSSRENWQDESEGDAYDFNKKADWYDVFDWVKAGVYNREMYQSDTNSYPNYTTTVYNLEVADFYTYFVGFAGIWVHNQNCGECVFSDMKKPVLAR